MNIFLLDQNPKLCAQYHTDAHVVKMILEHAQMMSTVVRQSGKDSGYKIAYQHHPCTKWVGESLANFYWLYNLTFYLNLEYRYRFNHKFNHKSFDVIDNLPVPLIPNIGLTNFALAMPEQYKNNDPIVAYRNYYKAEKAHLFKWTKRTEPEWLKWQK